MATLDYRRIYDALEAQPLFEDKTWRLSPQAWPLTPEQVTDLERIGLACLEFYRALDTLYRRSAEGRNLLRNRQLEAPWVAGYLNRGKPRRLIEHGRLKAFRGMVPSVIRPDLLLTETGFALTELDSVPGGLGLTTFLNNLYATESTIIGGGNDTMAVDFYKTLAALLPEIDDPVIAIIVTVLGLEFGSLIAFSIITETVFQWPGMGFLFIRAVEFADVPVMAAYLVLVALLFVSINLLVDMLYFAVDPRLRVDRAVAAGAGA